MATHLKVERDKRWSRAVIEKSDWKCLHCNEEADSPHHIVPRGNLKTRYILENGLNCCARLHRMFEASAKIKERAIRIYIGKERYENLQKIAHGQATLEDYGYSEVE